MLGTIPRMDSLLIGSIAAMMFSGYAGLRSPKRLTLLASVAFGIVLVGILITTWHADPSASFGFITTVGYTLLAIGCAAGILGAAESDGARTAVQRIFRNSILMRVGKYSYGMYVYHVPLLGLCQLIIFNRLPANIRSNPIFALAYIGMLTVGTFVIAAISFELVERRFLELKRFAEPLFYRRDMGAVTPPISAE